MKRRWTITLLVILLAAAGVGLFKYWPRTIDDDQCSALYRSYLHSPGIQSTYIKGKRLNDTLRIDLTLLQATSPQGWEQLQKDFNIPQPDSATAALLEQGNPDLILSILNHDSQPEAGTPRTDTVNGTIVWRVAPSLNIASQDICFSYCRYLRKVWKIQCVHDIYCVVAFLHTYL